MKKRYLLSRWFSQLPLCWDMFPTVAVEDGSAPPGWLGYLGEDEEGRWIDQCIMYSWKIGVVNPPKWMVYGFENIYLYTYIHIDMHVNQENISLPHHQVIFLLWVSMDRGYGYAAHRGVGNAVGRRPMLGTKTTCMAAWLCLSWKYEKSSFFLWIHSVCIYIYIDFFIYTQYTCMMDV